MHWSGLRAAAASVAATVSFIAASTVTTAAFATSTIAAPTIAPWRPHQVHGQSHAHRVRRNVGDLLSNQL